jgi:hypothetical protein
MPNTIDSRDNNAPWNYEELPPLTELEERDLQISELKEKMRHMVKKSDIVNILESYSESSAKYTIIKLKKILEL